MKLTTLERHKRVIDEWLHNGENGTKAYIKEYKNVSEKTAAERFSTLSRNNKIKQYIKEQREIMQQKAAQRHDVTFDSQLNDQLIKKKHFLELMKLANKEKLTEVEKERYKRLRDVFNLNGINKVDEIINKMLGFFKEDNEQSNQKEIIIEGFEWGKES